MRVVRPLDADEPTAVGPYRLLGRLGAGGMGRVYLGRSTGGRTVAVKIVHPHHALDEEFRTRFRREVEAARRVGGAWTAPVLDADPEARVPWVATAYVAGPPLTAAVADVGPLPAHTVRALGAGLAEALTAVHALGLVHRDVKPSNVLLTLDGPLLIDFGIARATDTTASLTATGVSVGSPGYMAPEQILGKGVTGAADVFSLGAVLAFAAAGEPPFPGDSSAALLYKVVHEEPELGSLDGDLRDLVASCLAKDPARRPGPETVATRLAPRGAADLVSGGWLPGRLVERVSRDAVELLNLDTGGQGGGVGADGDADVLSGPISFSRPSVRGEFGPPPEGMPGYLPTVGDVVPGSGPGPGHGLGLGSAPVPERRTGTGPDTNPAATPDAYPGTTATSHPKRTGRGGISVRLGAASGTGDGPNGRERRLSCTVVLAVAGALAAVTLGSAVLFDVFPGGGGPADTATGTKPPVTAGSSNDSAEPGEIPAEFLGTWEGPATALDGALPAGTFRVTVQQAAVGEKFGTLRTTDPLGGVCVDDLVLRKATAKELQLTTTAVPSNPGVCVTGTHTATLTRSGDSLTLTMTNAEAGDPVAKLRRLD